MIYREIVHTCSNANVARAAVDSIGGSLARRLSEDASKRGMSKGVWAASLVRDFARSADETQCRGVGEAARGADQPILAGLGYILEHAMTQAVPPAWMISAARAV